MANLTLRDSGATATGATSYVTNSISIPANDLGLLWVATETTTPTPTIIDANRTWVLIDSQTLTTFGNLSAFRSLNGSATAGTATIDFGGTTVANCTWICGSKDNVDTTGSNGSGAIGVTAKTNGNSATPSVTLAAFGNANRPTVGAFNINSNFRALTAGSGWTVLTTIEETAEDVEILVQYKTVEDNTVDATIGASADAFAIIAFEIVTLPEPIVVTASSIPVGVAAQSATIVVGAITATAGSLNIVVTAQPASANATGVLTLTPNSIPISVTAQPATVVSSVSVTAGAGAVALVANATVEQLYAEAAPITIVMWANPATAIALVTLTPASLTIVVQAQTALAVPSGAPDFFPVTIDYRERASVTYRG